MTAIEIESSEIARTPSFCSPVMAVQKTLPPAMMGEPIPSPSLADQRKFSVTENFVGSGLSDLETPLEFSPRNWGQSSALEMVAKTTTNATAKTVLVPTLCVGTHFLAAPRPGATRDAERPRLAFPRGAWERGF